MVAMSQLSRSFLTLQPLGRKDKLPFGKYVNRTIDWVAKNHPDYIIWLVENTPIEVVENIVEECEIATTFDNDCDYGGYEYWKD
jgi:hypothetical protein